MCDEQDVSYNAHVVVHVWAWPHYYCGHALFFVVVMADKLSILAAVAVIIIRRRRRRREARLGREWPRDSLKERQSEKGMEEFIMAELAADVGGFHGFLRMTNDQFTELLTYVEPIIIGCDTKMRECIMRHEMLVLTLRYLSSGWC